MIKRIVLVWLVANAVVVGLASAAAGRWYVGWTISPMAKMWVEVLLLMLPNLVLPVLVLRYRWSEPVGPVRMELGWIWNGRRSVLTGIAMFAVLYGAMRLLSSVIGEGIPYDLPGAPDTIRVQGPLAVVGVLVTILGFVVLTVVGEETMFRGLAQTQIGKRYGVWAGILVPAVLFGLRHLPNDLYYARVWQATPRMWVARELQLYLAAILLGVTRHLGRSTYASSVTHGLLLVTVLFGL